MKKNDILLRLIVAAATVFELWPKSNIFEMCENRVRTHRVKYKTPHTQKTKHWNKTYKPINRLLTLIYWELETISRTQTIEQKTVNKNQTKAWFLFYQFFLLSFHVVCVCHLCFIFKSYSIRFDSFLYINSLSRLFW